MTKKHAKIQRVALLGSIEKPWITSAFSALIRDFISRKIQVVVEEPVLALMPELSASVVSTTPDQLNQHADLMIAVGGDGNFIQSAQVAVSQNLPLLGINCGGRLGFLTDLTPESLEQLYQILQGQYTLEWRTVLHCSVKNNYHQMLYQGIALNDIILSKQDLGMIEYTVHVDGQFVFQQRADGFIVATPTGSTAYALSAGGPVLSPTAEAFVLVPMLAHGLNNRPLVIHQRQTVTLCTIIESAVAKLRCDNQSSIQLPEQATVVLRQHNHGIQFVHPIGYDYFEKLRKKLHWATKSASST